MFVFFKCKLNLATCSSYCTVVGLWTQQSHFGLFYRNWKKMPKVEGIASVNIDR